MINVTCKKQKLVLMYDVAILLSNSCKCQVRIYVIKPIIGVGADVISICVIGQHFYAYNKYVGESCR